MCFRKFRAIFVKYKIWHLYINPLLHFKLVKLLGAHFFVEEPNQAISLSVFMVMVQANQGVYLFVLRFPAGYKNVLGEWQLSKIFSQRKEKCTPTSPRNSGNQRKKQKKKTHGLRLNRVLTIKLFGSERLAKNSICWN